MKNQGVRQKIRSLSVVCLLTIGLGQITICQAQASASSGTAVKTDSTKITASTKNDKLVASEAAANAQPAGEKSEEVTASETSVVGAGTNDTTVGADDPGLALGEPPAAEKDPYQGFNRAMFTFNDKLDIYFLKPIATFYNKVMPKPLNKGVHNVFENINTVPTIANDVLQANFYQASSDFWRLAINTTIGIGGLFDMAERMKLEPYQNDFGLTLARWGYTDSNYLVLPFFGPNTLRDGLIGLPVDYFAFSLYPYLEPPSFRYQVYVLGVIDRRAQLLKFQDVVDEASYDKYVFVRNAYLQRRAYQIEQNNQRSCCDRMAESKATVTVDASTESTTVATTSTSVQTENYD